MTFAEGLSVERGLDDLRFEVYFDLMLVPLLNTVFLLVLFKCRLSVCVQNIQSIIQLKLISYSVRLCNNTLPLSTCFDLTPGKSSHSCFFHS